MSAEAASTAVILARLLVAAEDRAWRQAALRAAAVATELDERLRVTVKHGLPDDDAAVLARLIEVVAETRGELHRLYDDIYRMAQMEEIT